MKTEDNRPEVYVETSYYENQSQIELSEKVPMPYLNRFFIQLIRFHNQRTEVQICVDKAVGLHRGNISLKETIKFQDDILEVIDNIGVGRKLVLDKHVFDLVHFPNGEYGLACGNNRFIIREKEILLLQEFAAKTLK